MTLYQVLSSTCNPIVSELAKTINKLDINFTVGKFVWVRQMNSGLKIKIITLFLNSKGDNAYSKKSRIYGIQKKKKRGGVYLQ